MLWMHCIVDTTSVHQVSVWMTLYLQFEHLLGDALRQLIDLLNRIVGANDFAIHQ